MTYAARLTWQAKDVPETAAALETRLDVDGRDGGMAQGARLLHLGTALLEVRPWIAESSTDKPTAAGRLMLEPVPTGEEAPEPPADDDPRGLFLVGLGWATVELDRAEEELGMWLGEATDTGVTADPHVGARLRLRGGGSLPGSWLVFLEPDTEGRIAASLARDGEGPCALYLWPAAGLDAWLAAARARGVGLARRGPSGGPFGRQVLLAGPAAGPHVIIVEDRTPMSTTARMSTIAP